MAVAALSILVLIPGVNMLLATDVVDLFELDGDAYNASAAIDDWNVLYDAWKVDPDVPGGSAVAYTFIKDQLNSKTDDIFTTGGSKDVNNITQWRWAEGTVLDKDDIADAYAAAYIDPEDGNVLLYFGLDRYANNGDAMVGFWFLKNPVTEKSDGTFNPAHERGDILILAHFTGGGTVISIEVLKWIGPPDADNLELLYTSKDAFGIVNNETRLAPWWYQTKFPDTKTGNRSQFATGTFFEGGVDLTELLGAEEVMCFTTFLAETRSSTSYDAQLKDYVMGSFGLCACLKVTKLIDWADIIGDHADVPDVNFPVQVTGPYGFSANITFELRDAVLNATLDGMTGTGVYDEIVGSDDDWVTVGFHGLRRGDYTVTETPLPAGWDIPAFEPSDTVSVTGACTEVTVRNTPTPGCLQIVKDVDLTSVIGPIDEIPDVDFIITVTGPSYPTGHNLTFNLVDGIISGAQDLSDLIPGNYTVTETPPDDWTKDSVVTSPAEVSPGDACGDVVVTVTNSPIPGCLQIIKDVELSSVMGPISEIPDVDFIITVTGHSYPAGHNLTFNLVDGVISGAQNLTNLIPGNYTVVETPPDGWTRNSVVTSPAEVSPGDACGDVVVTVTNSPILGCLQIIKDVELSSVTGPISEIPDVDFIITVAGPSYPAGHNLTFNLVDGVISGAQNLTNLIPGNYTVVETPPDGWTKDSVVASPAEVSPGDECGDVVVTVTNSPILGCLQIVKSVDLGSVIGPISEIPDVDFIITVTGHSYPTGHNLTFNLVDGVISGAQNLTNLIPGNYTVVETPPDGWTKDSVVTSPAEVSPGAACGDAVVTVTNSPILGCLRVVKEIDKSAVAGGTPADGEFVINVSGPSYPEASGGHNLTFSLTGGNISGAQDLLNLIPGNYTAAEISWPDNWELVGYSPSQTVSVGAGAGCGTVNITVTNKYIPADVQVVKTGNITYTIIVSNNGTSPAEDVTVNDPLPGALNWTKVSVVPSLGTWNITGAYPNQMTLTGMIDSLDSGDSVTVTVLAAIDGHSDEQPALLGNNVTVSTTTPESKTDNNIDWADIFPLGFAIPIPQG